MIFIGAGSASAAATFADEFLYYGKIGSGKFITGDFLGANPGDGLMFGQMDVLRGSG